MCYKEIVVAEKQEDGTVTLQAYESLVPESEMEDETGGTVGNR